MLDTQRKPASVTPVVGAVKGRDFPDAGGAKTHPSGRLALLAVLLAVLAAVGAGTWAFYLRPVNVQVSQAERDVPVEVFGLGTVEARVASKVGFKVSGVLVDLRADVGDRVAKGSNLGRLDDREQSARVARTKASIAQAEANVQKATASVEKARANYNNAKRISERRQALVQSNSTSVEAAETAQAVQDAALGDFNLASSEVEVARASINDAKAQGLLESATLDFHTLTAPYNAMVIARTKELGSALGAGEPVFTLIDPATVWVLAYIDESKAGEINVGEPAQIVLRSQPGHRIAGRVARIEPESDRVNEERRVAVAFAQIPAEFTLGEQAEVYITTVRLTQPRLVPEAAIAGLGKGQGTVWTVEDGHLQQHVVTLGHRLLDGRHEITGGVPNDALVVSQLSSGLRVGRAAKVAGGKVP
ncbi:HlyD family efflux transporter periplasmic adaptor subunit [Bradyrhizobium sp. 192]|uniref:efflux RND transporter periplasmic adaptor subunit n=1 Tax=Bradyrhizobium sp. 192 TaxID=2782660 RepID=UPI00200011A3|nr:HlyD family efflux transporter periplasmic adaptor subunit [Bradyrhizobium sp. 192]UPJ57766.1 HlyD family efflux transporter periplasmic adaptor subunit [Bradyrhizobium sp. 192]